MIITIAFIIVIVLILIRSKYKVQKLLAVSQGQVSHAQVYEEIEIFDAMKNVAYEASHAPAVSP